MTLGDILMGLLVATGFFVAAAVARIFRRNTTGIIIGGVAGIAVSVAVLFYGMDTVFAVVDDPDAVSPAADAATVSE